MEDIFLKFVGGVYEHAVYLTSSGFLMISGASASPLASAPLLFFPSVLSSYLPIPRLIRVPHFLFNA